MPNNSLETYRSKRISWTHLSFFFFLLLQCYINEKRDPIEPEKERISTFFFNSFFSSETWKKKKKFFHWNDCNFIAAWSSSRLTWIYRILFFFVFLFFGLLFLLNFFFFYSVEKMCGVNESSLLSINQAYTHIQVYIYIYSWTRWFVITEEDDYTLRKGFESTFSYIP